MAQKNLKILIVEDEETIADLEKDYLERYQLLKQLADMPGISVATPSGVSQTRISTVPNSGLGRISQ